MEATTTLGQWSRSYLQKNQRAEQGKGIIVVTNYRININVKRERSCGAGKHTFIGCWRFSVYKPHSKFTIYPNPNSFHKLSVIE